MPNYPNNCHEVDIGLLTKNLSGFHQIQFNFRPDPRVQVEVMIEDRKQSLTRSYKYNKYGSVGSRMTIMNLTRNSYRQALATRKIVTRRDASIEKINKIWAVHFRP